MRIPIEVLADRISVWLLSTTRKRMVISPRITFGMYRQVRTHFKVISKLFVLIPISLNGMTEQLLKYQDKHI